MLATGILLRQRRQLPQLLPCRSVSSKGQRPIKAADGQKPKQPSSPASPSYGDSASPASTTSTSGNNTGQTTASNVQQALLRNRKLTPAAKAKAQASASRALREQLASINASGGTQAAEATTPNITTNPAIASTSSSLSQLERHTEQQEIAGQHSLQDQPLRRLHDVVAYATAESYDFGKLIGSGRLPQGWQLLEDDEVIHVPQWPQSPSPSSSSSSAGNGSEGEAFIFRSGSYVTWGMSSDQSRKFLRLVLQGRLGEKMSAEVNSYSHIGDEAMEYAIAEDQITRVVGDVIVIGQAPRTEPDEQFDDGDGPMEEHESSRTHEDPADWSPLLARLAFSQGLSRSARLSVQEAALSDYLEQVASLPGRLANEGKVPLHRKEVIRKMGTLLQLRQRANLDSENFLDDPEMYWENWKVEHHYDSICLALDIETRFKAYNEKLDHGENLLGVLRALLTESSTHRMELIIIYLIAFEVCLALISHEYVPSPKRVWNLLTGMQDPEERPADASTGLESEERILSSLRRLLLQQSVPPTTASPRLV